MFQEHDDKNLWDHIVQKHDGTLYRYVDFSGTYGVSIMLQKFEVLKQTAKGVWIAYGESKRFVQFNTRKKFACTTKEEAFDSFKARKKKQVKILKAQLEQAEGALRLSEGFVPDLGPEIIHGI